MERKRVLQGAYCAVRLSVLPAVLGSRHTGGAANSIFPGRTLDSSTSVRFCSQHRRKRKGEVCKCRVVIKILPSVMTERRSGSVRSSNAHSTQCAHHMALVQHMRSVSCCCYESHQSFSRTARGLGFFCPRFRPHDTSSPPSSMPRPSILPMRVLSPVGGRRVSKLSLRLASRVATGVLEVIGVRFHELGWAGLGDMLRKSAKLTLVEGVCRPNDGKDPPPPGVDIMDDGSGVDFGGGVEGAIMRGLEWDA